MLEYYQIPFRYLIETTTNLSYVRAQDQLPRALRRRFLFSNLKPGEIYAGEKAWKICERYLGAIEERMKRLLSDHSVYYWLSIIRRIRPGLVSPYEDKTDDHTSALVRRIQELAIRKYGRLDRDDDVRMASTAPAKEILGGLFEKLMRDRLGDDGFAEMYAAMVQSSQWVICDFGRREFFAIARLEGLAYEFWRTTAAMRTIGKGASIEHVVGASWIRFVDEQPDTDYLITSFDERIGRYSGAATLLGTWHPGPHAGLGGAALLAAGYNVGSMDVTELFRRVFKLHFVTGFVPNMLLTYRDVRTFWRTHQFMAEAFEKANGLGLSDLLYVLWALCNSALMPDRVLNVLEDPAATEADKRSAVAMSQQQLFSRGYSTRLYESEGFAKEVAGRAALFGVSLDATPPASVSLDAAVSWLTLTPKTQSQISLWSSGPYSPVIPHGAAICIDLAAVPFVLQSLFYGVRDKDGEKGTIFEEEFRRGLQSAGFTIEHAGEIHSSDGKGREIDASVRVGTTLYLFECFASERPLDFEIGKGQTIVKRSTMLSAKVDQAITLREFIIERPKGTNYDFQWATAVETFVVSPFVEWIWSRGGDLWAGDVPRILSASETLALLKRRAVLAKRRERKSSKKRQNVDGRSQRRTHQRGR
jgi:hypothetical protein